MTKISDTGKSQFTQFKKGICSTRYAKPVKGLCGNNANTNDINKSLIPISETEFNITFFLSVVQPDFCDLINQTPKVRNAQLLSAEEMVIRKVRKTDYITYQKQNSE